MFEPELEEKTQFHGEAVSWTEGTEKPKAEGCERERLAQRLESTGWANEQRDTTRLEK